MKTIISLTSHGKRINEVLFRALSTLLDQDIPSKVILYLDKDADPYLGIVREKFKALAQLGLEIRAGYENIGVHSKWFWALQEFPNDLVVLADDDAYYPRDWLRSLVEQYQKTGSMTCLTSEGVYYDEDRYKLCHTRCCPCKNIDSPLNMHGCLIPPNSFHSDVFNKELFLTLTPKADEIWLFAMRILNNKPVSFIDKPLAQKIRRNLLLIDQSMEAGGTCLWKYNAFEGGNVKQLNAVIAHYPILADKIKKFKCDKSQNIHNIFDLGE